MSKKTSLELQELIAELKQHKGIWRDAAKYLAKPRRVSVYVNLARIARHAKPGETILVPGKVLGYGDLSKKIRIAAFSFSSGAAKKIEKSGCKKMKIRDLMKENLKGSEIRIMV